MKQNLIISTLAISLIALDSTALAGTTNTFLQAITGQSDPVVQNVKDEHPGKNLASHYYVRSLAGTFDRVTPEVQPKKTSVTESLELYTNQFNK